MSSISYNHIRCFKSHFKARFRKINDIDLFIIDYSIFGMTTVSPMRDHRVLSKLVTKREKQMSKLVTKLVHRFNNRWRGCRGRFNFRQRTL